MLNLACEVILAIFNVIPYFSEKKRTRPESVDCTPPDYIMPENKERPLVPLQPQLKDQKSPQCVKVF